MNLAIYAHQLPQYCKQFGIAVKITQVVTMPCCAVQYCATILFLIPHWSMGVVSKYGYLFRYSSVTCATARGRQFTPHRSVPKVIQRTWLAVTPDTYNDRALL